MPRWRTATALLVPLVGLAVALFLLLGPEEEPRGGDGGRDADAGSSTAIAPGVSDEPAPPFLAPGREAAAKGAGDAGSGPADVEVLGIVYDADTGLELPGTTVEFVGSTGGREQTVSGVRGVYRIRRTLPPRWQDGLRLAKDGYQTRWLELRVDQSKPGTRLPPVGLRRIRGRAPGRVIDFGGRPVADASVRVEGDEAPYATDAQGRFGPVPLAGDETEWVAWSPTHPRVEGGWASPADALPTEVVVEMPPAAYVEGQVVDVDGRPVAGARVFARQRPRELTLLSDSDGRFRWPVHVGGDEDLVAVAGRCGGRASVLAGMAARLVVRDFGRLSWLDAFAPRAAPAPPPPPRPPGPPVRIRVLVLDEAGQPLPWAGVSANGLHEWTDADGRGEILVPPSEDLSLSAGHWRAENVGIVEALDPAHGIYRLMLPPRRARSHAALSDADADVVPEGPSYRGTVLDAEGRPFPGAQVATGDVWGITDERGRFSLSASSRTAQALIQVVAEGYAPLHVWETAGEDVDVRFPGRGGIRVLLTVRLGPEQSADYRLWAAPSLTDDAQGDLRAMVRETAKSVRVDCPQGAWHFAFRAGGGDWVFYPDLHVVAGHDLTVHYDVRHLGRVMGTVTTETGWPIPGASLFVAQTGAMVGTTDGQGRIRWSPPADDDRVPAGYYPLRVLASGYAPTTTQALDLTSEVEIHVTLQQGVPVIGTLTDFAGNPVATRLAWWPSDGYPGSEVESDEDGEFDLDMALPPGPARFYVWPPLDGRFGFPTGEPDVVEAVIGPSGETTIRLPVEVTGAPPR